MDPSSLNTPDAERDRHRDDEAAAALGVDDVVVLDGWLGAARARGVHDEVVNLLDERFAFRAAGVGAQKVRAAEVRRDRICWFRALDDAADDGADGTGDNAEGGAVTAGPGVAVFLRRLDALRQALNERWYLGAAQLECHAACYEPGAFYKPHTDALHGDDRRVISCCYYLNDAWTEAAGGCLRIHGADTAAPRDIAPLLDRLVLFRSAAVLHEVLPTAARRLSITGWLTRVRR